MKEGESHSSLFMQTSWRLTLITVLLSLLLVNCYFPEVQLSESDRAEVEASLKARADDVSPKIKINAIIDDQVKLLGIDLDRKSARPGEVIQVTYYLEGLAEQQEDNQVFVHLQGRRSGAWQNLDHTPVRGLFPLRKLKRGQVVVDRQRFRVKQGYPAGPVHLYWGLFRGKRRLKIMNPDQVSHDRNHRVKIAELKILPPKPPRVISASAKDEGEQIQIDGRLDEKSWQTAAWQGWWVDPLGRSATQLRRRGRSIPRTRAKLLWDEEALYIAVEALDADVWATLTDRDSNTWEQEVVEVFIDPDGDKRDYVELQVSPANVVFDAQFKYHRSDLTQARSWNFKGWETAVWVDGTLNKRDDQDKRYIVEMRLPLIHLPGAPPRLSAQAKAWRINLFRFDWDEAPKGSQRSAALSPPKIGDFHYLDAFAKLTFRAPRPRINPSTQSPEVKVQTSPAQPADQPLVTQQKLDATQASP